MLIFFAWRNFKNIKLISPLSFSPIRLFQEERLAILVVGIHNGWRKTCQNHPRPQSTNGSWVNVKALYPIGLIRSRRLIWRGLHTERIINTGPKLSRPLPTAVMDRPRRPQAHRIAVPLQVEVRREPQPRGLREKLGLDHVFTLLWPFFQRTVAVITLKCGQQNPYIIPGDYKFVCWPFSLL